MMGRSGHMPRRDRRRAIALPSNMIAIAVAPALLRPATPAITARAYGKRRPAVSRRPVIKGRLALAARCRGNFTPQQETPQRPRRLREGALRLIKTPGDFSGRLLMKCQRTDGSHRQTAVLITAGEHRSCGRASCPPPQDATRPPYSAIKLRPPVALSVILSKLGEAGLYCASVVDDGAISRRFMSIATCPSAVDAVAPEYRYAAEFARRGRQYMAQASKSLRAGGLSITSRAGASSLAVECLVKPQAPTPAFHGMPRR